MSAVYGSVTYRTQAAVTEANRLRHFVISKFRNIYAAVKDKIDEVVARQNRLAGPASRRIDPNKPIGDQMSSICKAPRYRKGLPKNATQRKRAAH